MAFQQNIIYRYKLKLFVPYRTLSIWIKRELVNLGLIGINVAFSRYKFTGFWRKSKDSCRIGKARRTKVSSGCQAENQCNLSSCFDENKDRNHVRYTASYIFEGYSERRSNVLINITYTFPIFLVYITKRILCLWLSVRALKMW